jgi:hypothetical protein
MVNYVGVSVYSVAYWSWLQVECEWVYVSVRECQFDEIWSDCVMYIPIYVLVNPVLVICVAVMTKYQCM